MDQSNPQISVEYANEVAIATIRAEKILEESDIQSVESTVMPLIGNNPVKLVIDFSNVKFLTSSALGLLIRISKKVYESDGQLRLACIDRKILEIFKITRLDKVFEIHADRNSAITSMS